VGEYEFQVQPEFDYVGMSFVGNTVVAESKQVSIEVLPAGLELNSWRYRVVKRAIDIVGAIILLSVCIAPSILIAVVIALTSKGSVFYREMRVGQSGKLFRIWKFRSMRARPTGQSLSNSRQSSGVLLHWRIHKIHSDPRITPVGGFLRRWSLDELPQLLNVLRGEMSLIGPRPVVEDEVHLYGQLRHYYLAAVPGLSGLWQVSGRSNVSFELRANLDASYVRNWSILNDLSILWRTMPAVLGRVGAR